MTASFTYLDYQMGGSVPGKFDILAGAGSIITVLDYILTQTSYPWTKTVVGTNVVTYQAPAGSQLKIQVEDEATNSTGLYARVRGFIGAQQFPTTTQETTSGMGPILLRKQTQTGTNAAYAFGWQAWKTDRLLMLVTAYSTSSSAASNAGLLIAGDLPTASPSDAGLCVICGTLGSTAMGGAGNYVSSSNLSHPLYYNNTASHIGYAYNDATGTNLSPLVYARHGVPSSVTGSGLTLVQQGGTLPLLPLSLFSSATSTGSASWTSAQHRGFLPYIYNTLRQSDVNFKWQSTVFADSGYDTFTIGGFTAVPAFGPAADAAAVTINGDFEAMP